MEWFVAASPHHKFGLKVKEKKYRKRNKKLVIS
jgi:hypothetical protein